MLMKGGLVLMATPASWYRTLTILIPWSGRSHRSVRGSLLLAVRQRMRLMFANDMESIKSDGMTFVEAPAIPESVFGPKGAFSADHRAR